jgi:hypothetical protein
MNRLVITWNNHDYDITAIDYMHSIETSGGAIHVLRCFHGNEAFVLRVNAIGLSHLMPERPRGALHGPDD